MLHITERPDSFEKVIGNKEIVTSIQSLLKKENHPHSYLLYGQSGCGKTTIARIMAKELNISENDIQEINSSNNRGIDTARDIIQNVHYKPLQGKYKMYILDEVHKATKDFQNAMLKVLEDTPSHVYFVLCTTEPEQIIKTIRTRCSSFEVLFPAVNVLARFLKGIAEKYKKKFPASIYKAIAEHSENSIRQSLIILEQILEIEDEEKALSVINSIKSQEAAVIELCRALIKKQSWSTISKLLKNIQEEPEKVRRAVLGYASAVLLNAGDEQAAEIIDNFKDNFYDSGKAGLVYASFLSVI
jgi:DNA polymerase III subunit gamma/tau